MTPQMGAPLEFKHNPWGGGGENMGKKQGGRSEDPPLIGQQQLDTPKREEQSSTRPGGARRKSRLDFEPLRLTQEKRDTKIGDCIARTGHSKTRARVLPKKISDGGVPAGPMRLAVNMVNGEAVTRDVGRGEGKTEVVHPKKRAHLRT